MIETIDNLKLTSRAEELAAREEIVRRFSSPELMSSLVQRAVHEAVLGHKGVGNPIAAWQEGKVVMVQPEDIELPEG